MGFVKSAKEKLIKNNRLATFVASLIIFKTDE